MKTTQILAAALLATGIFTVNAQTNLATSTITSRGLNAGTLGTGSTFFGYQAGQVNTATGTYNTFIGHQSGLVNTTGGFNVFLGSLSGANNQAGNQNTCVGHESGRAIDNGNNNVYLGNYTGGENESGSFNVFLGSNAGGEANGSNNVYLGAFAGYSGNVNNKLIIDSNSTFVNTPPLIWGDFAADLLKFNGKVGIGYGFGNYPTTAGSVNVAAYKLFVDGGILAKEVRVATTWADYVFEDSYKLPTLPEVEQYINENGHLPNVPSAKQVEEDGIEVGEMAKIQQEKIEELTLYAIQQQKQLEKQQKEIDELKALVLKLAGTK